MNLLIVQGPNLNMLHKRSKEHYGTLSMESIHELIIQKFPNDTFTFFQSNDEGELIEVVQTADLEYDGVIINPGGYSHTSVALHDALEICLIPKVEVHLSNILARDSFRRELVTARACTACISGAKEHSYLSAVFLIKSITDSLEK